jgi:hypothetical protein
MAEYRLRRASIEDARSIAELHAKAWRESYLGVMRASAGGSGSARAKALDSPKARVSRVHQ